MNRTIGTILAILCALVWVLGVIGGVGYLLYFKQPLFGVCVACLGALSAPRVWGLVKEYLIG